ncbi:MAG: hypothetical protein H6811_06435 [Phycisphaeraceae bacterium]|nr:hypothetical protein [Phycisphaeraceae bacterium]
MNPKSGKAGTAITPLDPTEALEADDADPGEIAELKASQRENQTGKYGQAEVTPFKPTSDDNTDEETETHWIEIELVGEDDKPITGQPYRITLPDGSVTTGSTDQNGIGRVDGIPDSGECKVTFPDLDQDAWEAI